MTLIVGCTNDLTMTDAGTYSLSETLYVNDPVANIYTFVPPTITPTPPSYCPYYFTLVNLQLNGGVAVGNEIGFSSGCAGSPGCATLDLASSAVKEVLTFNIRATIGTSNQILDSSLITVNVVSCLDLNTINNGAGLVALTVWQIKNSDPDFPVDAFTNTDPRCPITSIEIFSDDTGTGTSPPSSMYPASIAVPNAAFNVYSSVQAVEFDYVFYIKVTGTENQVYWAELASSRIFTLRVVCGPLSTVLTEGSFSGGLTTVQYIDKMVGGAF